ncbi:hypothetical protein ZIOFF_052223 [Zingiber officinale]|uniref:Uncharacterized protein n=1 Tax=Zingiber officinale TaxID=94328 RepID=A0A8J5KTG5_ZINOF|nr:hypothetical protein ZIOFF_052223 [Zingiber officinale]
MSFPKPSRLYSPRASNLCLLLTAFPPSSSSWLNLRIIQAINPSGGVMIEYQTLITFRQTDNKMGGKVKLPKGTTMVNQVWQMGAKVMDGVPRKDNFKPLKSMGKVDLLSREITATGSSTSRSKIVSEILAISILLFTQKLLSGSKNNFLGFIVDVILCTDLGGICGRAQLFHTATTPSRDLNLQLGDFVSGDESGDGNHLPRSTCDFIVTTQASKDTPSNMQLKDKFLIQTTVVPMVVWMRTSFQVFSEKKLAAYPIVTIKSELIKEVLMRVRRPCMVYLHVSCQILSYDIGVSGWTIGLALGNKSKGIVHTTHRNIGITLFTLCTLQVDNHEFWFMGFLNYDIAVHHMYEALRYMQKEASPQR